MWRFTQLNYDIEMTIIDRCLYQRLHEHCLHSRTFLPLPECHWLAIHCHDMLSNCCSKAQSVVLLWVFSCLVPMAVFKCCMYFSRFSSKIMGKRYREVLNVYVKTGVSHTCKFSHQIRECGKCGECVLLTKDVGIVPQVSLTFPPCETNWEK